MNGNQKTHKKYPGFFRCDDHQQLQVILQDKPPTVCRTCFSRIRNNLVLYLAEVMASNMRTEHLAIRNGDLFDQLLEHLEKLDDALRKLESKVQ